MSDPILLTLTDDLDLPDFEFRSVGNPPFAVHKEDEDLTVAMLPLLIGPPGPQGPQGTVDNDAHLHWFALSFNAYTQDIVVNGPLEIDFSLGRSVNLTMEGNVTSFSIINWPSLPDGVETSLVLNIHNNGNHMITSWPTGAMSQGGIAPAIGVGAGKRSCVILRTVDGGSTIFVDVVANNYAAIP